MNNAIQFIEVSNMPDLLHLVKEVQALKIPRILTVRGENMVMVMPVGVDIAQEATLSDQELWGNYDPQRVHQALQQSTSVLADVNKNTLLTDIAQQREQANHHHSQ